MAKQTNTPIVHVYKEINKGKYRSVKHYELVEVQNGRNQLTEKLNISKDRNCAKSSPTYWLQIREGNKWVTPRLTGLFKTDCSNIFKGDVSNRKHLLLMEFSDGTDTFKVFYYKEFYTSHIDDLEPIFKKV